MRQTPPTWDGLHENHWGIKSRRERERKRKKEREKKFAPINDERIIL